ncbi:MAG: patatin-like phospholipase family protein, partial [Candidatus Cloacimonadaceae bacterium]|nr:patatin-like phospholipase family protein [Candidatus Cloacimonadaceae bacterium]
PFACVATDLINGQPVVFDKGSLMQAVRASMSIPSIIMPFELGEGMYIDGGIAQNIPVTVVRDMGADVVIGLKVNSTLRTADNIRSFVDVLDQTINIGITRNLDKHLSDCELLLEPHLDDHAASDFKKLKAVIDAGEAYARANLDLILAFRDSCLVSAPITETDPLAPLGKIRLKKINCIGNKYLSGTKIIEYLGIETGARYSAAEISLKCRNAWNSQLFYTIYPVLSQVGSDWHLNVYVKEKERKHLSLNANYTSEHNLVAGLIFTMNNEILKNSSLRAAISLGGRTEGVVDYVKNFGDFWGSYFRLFSYLNEDRIYIYQDNARIGSVKALEYGFNGGVGVFANKLVTAETFVYTYRNRLYRDVSATAPLERNNLVGGFGVKLYHESLDDYYFPMRGARASLKANFSRQKEFSDIIFNKFIGNLELNAPLLDVLSLKLSLDYGSYFSSDDAITVTPLYFGGSQGFRGYARFEKSAPFYRIYELALRSKVRRNTFFTMAIQGLSYDEIDDWAGQDITLGLYAELGINTIFGPIRLSGAIREKANALIYVNIGYDIDAFGFSRN